MTNVIFLDIDGVLLPGRVWIDHPETKSTMFISWDPIAVRMLNKLVKEANAKIVISSTWAALGKEEFVYHMEKNGMDPKCLWNDTFKWTSHIGIGSRHDSIQVWLDQHKDYDLNWIAIDDDPSIKPFAERAILTSFDDGFLSDHYNIARKMFGVTSTIF